MRFATLFLFFFLIGAYVHAGDTLRVVVLHDTLGMTIDSSEKAAYHLFPFWYASDFHHAEYVMNADSSLSIIGTMKDGSTRVLPCSKQEFAQHRYLVYYYAGQVAPPESLWPMLIEIVVRGTAQAAFGGCD
ncbi:MAG TPA: hypothetical protein VK826_08270 [Bacteroidia bacterium]|nr:hypothetical protein [Bacteroidia bacterium]